MHRNCLEILHVRALLPAAELMPAMLRRISLEMAGL
jgi:hypothetical protein